MQTMNGLDRPQWKDAISCIQVPWPLLFLSESSCHAADKAVQQPPVCPLCANT